MPYEIKDIVKIIKNKRDELNLSLRDLSSKTGFYEFLNLLHIFF